MSQVAERERKTEAEAVYTLERPVVCGSCKETVGDLHVVRLLRTRVNFTSSLPRRGFVIICPSCQTIVAANIGTKMI